MGRAHFLLCLPARLGVLIFSLAEFVMTGFLAAILWIAFVRNEQHKDLQLSKSLLVGVITVAVISSIIALCSFAGLVGALFKQYRGIRVFARVVAWLLGVQIISSVLYIIAIFVEPKSEFIKQCEAGRTDSTIVDTCTNKIQEVKGITVAIIVVALLLHAYELHVVRAYANELEQKELNRNIILGNSKYAAVPHGEDSRPLTGPDMSYPYADGVHAHGHSHGGSYV